MVLNIANPTIVNGVVKGLKNVTQASAQRAEASKRAASIQNLSSTKKQFAKSKGYIFGAFKPIMDKLEEMSDNVNVISKTLKKIKRNVNKNSSTIKGVKESSPEIKSAIKELSGINDVKAATEKGGITKGAIEAGKAAVRVSSSTALFVAGNFVPVPGASVVGWLAGEKLSNFLLGKPFTKQVSKMIKK